MFLKQRALWLVLAFLIAAMAGAAPPAARAEIDELLSRLEASGCLFGRNDLWYPPGEARSHLMRKLRYLEDRIAVQSAEQFIELAASHSSTSGKPYLVKCGDRGAVESGSWLHMQLRDLRSARRSLR